MTELHFKGKEFVYNHHLSVPVRPLEVHPDKGIGAARLDGNLVIQGDNLHALKAMLPYYAGKVDCIYIDPPYNTGAKDWSYHDDVNAPMIKEWLMANPISFDDTLRHDKWCAMMWPRLKLLAELLSPEGTIFISINSIEFARLKLICDEIFGQDGYIGEFSWKSRNNKDNRNEDGLSNDHEFVLIYGAPMDGELRSAADYTNPDNDPRGPWASANMVGLASKDKRPNLHYDLINPVTDVNYGCPKQGWRFEQATLDRLIEEKRILWPGCDDGRPRRKAFLSELDARTNVSSAINGTFYTNTGSKRFNAIMPTKEFPFPKPKELVEFILSMFERKDILVLDSFAGSGSTADAVLSFNSVDGGSRRFVLVEMENYADDLTAERVRRVIAGYNFFGTQKMELLRDKITWTKLKNADRLTDQVETIENLHGHEYDAIKKAVKEGELIVTGEREVQDRAEGLGGEFTYCTLGPAIELDKILTGETLPDWKALGSILFHMATNTVFDPALADEGNGYLGRANASDGTVHVWLIYRSDLNWLKSPEAALSLSGARTMAATAPDDRHVVFAPAQHVSRKLLDDNNLKVQFAPLPFALYRVECD